MQHLHLILVLKLIVFMLLWWIIGIEMQDNKCGEKLAQALKGKQIDILINNAGYFYEPVEKIDSLNFEEVTYCPHRARFYSFFYFFCFILFACIFDI
jgi:hypothetical protein